MNQRQLEKEAKRLLNQNHPITLKLWEDEEERDYIVEIPMLPGCRSHGSTVKEALESIMEAKEGWILTKLEFGDHISESDLLSPVIEYLGEYSEEEKDECYQAVEKMHEILKEINKRNKNVLFIDDYK